MTPTPKPASVATSVRARLLNVAKAQGVDFNQVLVRFALERILYRLAESQHAERFLLKGALLFTFWYELAHAPLPAVVERMRSGLDPALKRAAD